MYSMHTLLESSYRRRSTTLYRWCSSKYGQQIYAYIMHNIMMSTVRALKDMRMILLSTRWPNPFLTRHITPNVLIPSICAP